MTNGNSSTDASKATWPNTDREPASIEEFDRIAHPVGFKLRPGVLCVVPNARSEYAIVLVIIYVELAVGGWNVGWTNVSAPFNVRTWFVTPRTVINGPWTLIAHADALCSPISSKVEV